MTKNKLFLWLIPLLFITGCSVDYKMEILDNKAYAIYEEFSIIDGMVDYGYNLNELVENIQARNGIYYDFYELDDAGDYCMESEDENCDPNSVPVNYGVGAQKRYAKLTDISTSKAINDYFGKINITSSGSKYKIIGTPSSSLGAIIEDVNLFKGIISSLKVSIKIPYVVVNNNADSSDNGTYIWNFDKSNYNNKTINLEWTTNNSSQISNDEPQQIINNDNKKTFNIMYVLIGLAIIGAIVGIYLLIKNKNNNKV